MNPEAHGFSLLQWASQFKTNLKGGLKMEERYWERIRKEPGEYIATVVLLHLKNSFERVTDRLERLGTKPWPLNGTSYEQIEPLLKEKWQDLTQEKRNETIRIFHHVSEAVREELTDWFDSLKTEIENLAKGGEYSGAYLGSYGDKIGPWDVLDGADQNINKVKGIIRTVLLALGDEEDEEEEEIISTLDVAHDFLKDAKKEISLAMHMIAGHYPKKNGKGQA